VTDTLHQELALMREHFGRELALLREHFDRELGLVRADLRQMRWMVGTNTALILLTLAAVIAS
jgi:hypothetical protein